MKILALYGSSRRGGNTDVLTDRLLRGLPSTKVYLAEKEIRAIVDRRHDPEGFTPVADDHEAIVEQMFDHDVVVFATPVYWYGMSGVMKDFVDRWSHSLRDSRYDFRTRMQNKRALVVLVGGDEPRFKALPAVLQFQHIFDFVGMHFMGYIIGEGNRPGDISSDERALFEADYWNRRLAASE